MTNVTDPVAHKAFLAQGAGSAALLADIVLEPTPDPSLPDPNRFPYNELTDGKICACGPDSTGTGCARTEILKILEADFGIYITKQQQFVIGNYVILDQGRLYYYKPGLIERLAELNADPQDLDVQTIKVDPNIPTTHARPQSLSDIMQIINLKPGGMPTFIKETANFYQFDATGFTASSVTIDSIDRDMLNNIFNTFTGPAYPNIFKFIDGLYDVNGKLYFIDLVKWKANSGYKSTFFGVHANPTAATANYPNAASESYFFPFATITTEQQQLINICQQFFKTEIDKTLVIKSL